MKAKVAAVAITVLLIALSMAFFAEAGQKSRAVEASGILEEEKVAVGIPVELALLGMDMNKGLKSSTGKSGPRKPAGVVEALHVEPGDLVKRGDPLLTISGGLARENLKKAQAQYDFIQATIEGLEDKRGELTEKRSELNEAEVELKSKRAEAKREFSAKYAEGQAKITQMQEKLASVKSGLERAQAGLAAATRAESEARKALDSAQALPDSDPTKAQRIEQANATLQGAVRKQAELGEAIRQLSAVKSQLESGIARATAGLAAGKQRFNQGLSKMNEGLVNISEGRRKVGEGTSEIAGKVAVLKKRRDQAEVGLAIARKVMETTKIRAGTSGRIKDLKIAEGSVLYPGQVVMSITHEDRLRLNIYIPVKDAGRIAKGDTVEVMVDTAPGRIFEGRVIGLGGKAMFAPTNLTSSELELIRVIHVTVEVVNEDGILKAGMPADVRVITGGV
ncbi:MAG: HlyD family efflux transporter periplasmic adaptor subunit [Actinobacteria bacterium]|nr:HlyD family efflux transporter periplasmic adaptor subunit [Actinomycetota bacterium]